MSISNTELRAGLNVLVAVADSIKEAKRIPAGHLYAMMTGYIDLCSFERIIELLKRSHLIYETPGHELVWQLNDKEAA